MVTDKGNFRESCPHPVICLSSPFSSSPLVGSLGLAQAHENPSGQWLCGSVPRLPTYPLAVGPGHVTEVSVYEQEVSCLVAELCAMGGLKHAEVYPTQIVNTKEDELLLAFPLLANPS